MNNILDTWCDELRQYANPEKAGFLSGFFKTNPGEYGENDCFIGIKVPENRSVSKKYYNAPFEVIGEMINSPVHEFRLAAFLALVERYKKYSKKTTDIDKLCETVEFYILNAPKANNWDLVDLSAPYILGAELVQGRRTEIIYSFITDSNLWRNRIAIVSMLALIRNNSLELPFNVAKRSLLHTHSLMKKATGWILREIYKKNPERLLRFLKDNIADISAITLSYATEKLSANERNYFRALRKGTRE